MTADGPRSKYDAILEDDARSTFFHDDVVLPYGFSFPALNVVVNAHFRQECVLRKLAEGGFHKVYQVFAAKAEDGGLGQSLDAVIRVASPVFPGDKMRSEIATLAYIATHTSIPVPAVYAWNTDSSNPVGAEWMIMQKIPGMVPFDIWKDVLPIDVKLNVIRQVAQHLRELFSLRFPKAGSIYFAADAYSRSSDATIERSAPGFKIGPIVSDPFYRCLGGKLDYPSTNLHSPGSPLFAALHALRGPFTHTGEFLAHGIRANLFKYDTFPKETLDMVDTTPINHQAKVSQESQQEAFERAKRTMMKAIKLCDIYPGDAPVWDGGLSTPDRPFTLHWYDLRLANILIHQKTGTVNGYIDFEGAVTAPLWLASEVVDWVPDPMTDRTTWFGGTRADQFRLWKTFHSTMAACDSDGEWRKAYEGGKHFRRWAGYLGLGWEAWPDYEAQVDSNLTWASRESNRGVGRPEIDETWGINWDVWERKNILKMYGPDPTDPEATEALNSSSSSLSSSSSFSLSSSSSSSSSE